MKALLEALEARGGELSRSVVMEMYAENPFWTERFGERGRGHAGKDGDFHLQYLVQALAAEEPGILTRYATWLQEVLSSRGMCTRHLEDNFSRLAQALIAAGLPNAGIAADYLHQANLALLHASLPARQLQRDANRLSEQVVVKLMTRDPDGLSGPGAQARCRDDLRYHLSYLSDAIGFQRSDTFVRYIGWVADFLERRKVSRAHLIAAFEALRDTLHLELPECAASAEPLLKEALETLRASPQGRPS